MAEGRLSSFCVAVWGEPFQGSVLLWPMASCKDLGFSHHISLSCPDALASSMTEAGSQ